MNRQRFDVVMSRELTEQLEQCSDLSGYTRGEVFRRAIALYGMAIEHEAAGGKVLFRQEDGSVTWITGITPARR